MKKSIQNYFQETFGGLITCRNEKVTNALPPELIRSAGLIFFLLWIFFSIFGKPPIDLAVFLRAGERFLTGELLYQYSDGHFTFKYFPINALIWAIFSPLPSVVSAILWRGIIFFSAYYIFIRSAGRAVEGVPDLTVGKISLRILTVFAVTATYFFWEIHFGQSNIVMFACLWASAEALIKGQARKSAFWLSMGFIIKPYALLFLPYLIWKRNFKAALYTIELLIIVFLTPIIVYGWDEFVFNLSEFKKILSDSSAVLYTDDWNGSVWGMYAKAGISRYLSLWSVVTVGLLAGIYAYFSFGKLDGKRFFPEIGVLWLLIPAVSPQGWYYIYWCAVPALLYLYFRFHLLSRLKQSLLLFISSVFAGLQYELLGKRLYTLLIGSPLIPATVLVLFCLTIQVAHKDDRTISL